MVRCAALLLFFVVAGPAHAAPPDLAELPGPLVLTGGKEVPKDVAAAFFELAGKDKARIVVIPTAIKDAEDPDVVAEELKPWGDLKPASVTSLHTRERKTADDPEFVKVLADATGVWFCNGHTDRILNAYRGTLVEKELKRLHGRGVVIGAGGGGNAAIGTIAFAGGAEKPAPALDVLPGFLVERKEQIVGAIADNPALVGLQIPDGAGVVIRGRTMRVIGDQPITIRIAKGAGKPAAAQVAKAGSIFDLFQLRRAALNRAAEQPFPPAKPKDAVVEKGTLVIVGGGGTTQKIMDAFLTAAGGKDALIVVIPTTETAGPGDAAYLRKFGATNVKVLFTTDRKLANDPTFSEALMKAGGVWFGGGRQWRFVDSFEGALVQKRCHEVLARGGAIGGSSAGASIQSEYMPRGHPLGNTVMAAEGYEKGFGFLPGCAVDQHFFARERRADMTGLIQKYPQYLGIGIDESTAIVVTGSTAEVMGRSRVAFYDSKKKPRVNYEWDAAGRLVWFDADYEELTVGEKYDLKKRERIK